MNNFLITLLTLSISASLIAAEGFSSLEEQMSGKEFNAAGLDKLSQQELDALNAWIRGHSLATLDAPAASAAATAGASTGGDRRGFKTTKADEDRTPITSRIVGRFSGWDGQTIFKLENGMIWAQADKDTFYIKKVQDAVAIIEPGMFGTWRLHVEGFNSECRVKRIQ
jgi:hypothetical protein